MKWFLNPCGRYRQGISLLAGGVLSEPEKDQLARHLAACAGCRKYYEEIQAVTIPLANWEKDLAYLQPDQAAQDRWAKAIQAAGQPEPVYQPTPGVALHGWWQDVFRPYRRVWAGLAAVWVVILAGNFSLRDHSPALATKSAPRSQEIIMALNDRQKIMAELLQDHSIPREAERPRSFSPKPRTEYARILTV
jgi:hypothetical protein